MPHVITIKAGYFTGLLTLADSFYKSAVIKENDKKLVIISRLLV